MGEALTSYNMSPHQNRLPLPAALRLRCLLSASHQAQRWALEAGTFDRTQMVC
jgi:hypothetical protein